MDTSEITQLYMQRPGVIAHVPMGQWFCTALNIKDRNLFYSKGAETKRIIVQNKYNELPDLTTQLNEYNLTFKEP